MEIQICKSCKGLGVTVVDEEGYHSREWTEKTCSKCNGTGRVKTRSYSYTVPFDTDDHIIYKTNTEIINLIRKLESK